MVGLRKYYWYSKWNLFDFLILLVSLVEIILELSFPMSSSKFSPAVLRIVRILRILRVGRVLRLAKVWQRKGIQSSFAPTSYSVSVSERHCIYCKGRQLAQGPPPPGCVLHLLVYDCVCVCVCE